MITEASSNFQIISCRKIQLAALTRCNDVTAGPPLGDLLVLFRPGLLYYASARHTKIVFISSADRKTVCFLEVNFTNGFIHSVHTTQIIIPVVKHEHIFQCTDLWHIHRYSFQMYSKRHDVFQSALPFHCPRGREHGLVKSDALQM